MSYFPRADDFAPRLGYDHTLTGPEDFIFNHDTIQRVSPTEDTLSDTLSPSYDLEDFRSFPSPPKNYNFSTKYEKFHVTPSHRAGYNKIYNFRRSKSFFFELVDHLPNTNELQLKIYTNDYHMSSSPISHNSTSQLPNFKFQISKQLTHFFSTQKVIPRRFQEKFFTLIRKKLLERLDFIVSHAQKKDTNNHMTKTFFNFSYKKYRFYFGKVYKNFQHTPSSRPKVKKRQEARFNASMRKTFHNAKLTPDAPMDDKLQAARHHKFLFQENQHFSTPIKHLRYKKKFIVPKQDDYTFPLPFPETNTNLMVAMSDLNPIDSSVVSTLTGNSTPPSSIIDTFENVPAHYVLLIPEEPFYKGGLLNQPSRSKIRKRNLNPLTVGSNAWLAHMKEIYDQHEEDMKYEREKTDAGIRWDTTPD
ncbi:hypothetical protein GLOIN_2v1885163 [Rhizophagus irregularis DAOM 181602=DAOM 197198]|uniref:DUF8211 domain-containing protein n=4 Tax=Rhizophagus irregularis TaxID=588596 RepID=A0A2P4P1M1_RHIID|nr:hypothetical protein GLOIN_2v1885163 [Rhizophagus irregularis DAOM 181602=DAOM 197198]POG59289.1 hypothetical protein GLOIN_2v1885163 [Rhizophagus irregularis DAOM 181602=DAOM 197198]|eukprot:XP_025166155.1 hypothetical protein GLOIN_2v1885163 [Rhizophagus irregularis DAOM 181602=DAOM 197198]